MKKWMFVLFSYLSMSWLLAAVNINTANEEELQSLKGIGKVKAAAIVDYRQQVGAFQFKEEIKQVKGIGEKTYAQIESEIEVGAKAAVKPKRKMVMRATENVVEQAVR